MLSKLFTDTTYLFPLLLAGCCSGMLLWACCTLHLGSGNPGCRTELHHDRNLFWPVCHGSTCCFDWYRLEKEEITLLLLLNLMLVRSSWTSPNLLLFPIPDIYPTSVFFFSGISKPKVVTLCTSDPDPLYCNYPHTACCRLPRCRTSNGDEWLPQCSTELTGVERAGKSHISFSQVALHIACWYQA